jgi:hypothetical protein
LHRSCFTTPESLADAEHDALPAGGQISLAVSSNSFSQRSKWAASTGSGMCLTIGVP